MEQLLRQRTARQQLRGIIQVHRPVKAQQETPVNEVLRAAVEDNII